MPNTTYVVAGGAPSSSWAHAEHNDYDLFFSNGCDRELAQAYMKHKLQATLVYDNENASCYNYARINWDLIKIFYDDPIDLLESFDLSCCKIAVDETGVLVHESFLRFFQEDQTLEIYHTNQPTKTLARVKKYLERYKSAMVDSHSLISLLDEIPELKQFDKDYYQTLKERKKLSK